MKKNYLVSVFVDGKNVNSYFSENLDDLVTIKAMHKGCGITIFDLRGFALLTKEQVDREIVKSSERRKRDMAASVEKPTNTIPKRKGRRKNPNKAKKPKKYWKRPVKCVETGQIFLSIRDCAEHLGLSHTSIFNAINSGNARKGLHFVNATKQPETR